MEMSGISGVYIVSAEGNAVFQMVQLGEAGRPWKWSAASRRATG